MGSSLVVDGLTGMFICREKGCRKQFTRKVCMDPYHHSTSPSNPPSFPRRVPYPSADHTGSPSETCSQSYAHGTMFASQLTVDERPQFFCDGCPKGFTRYDLLERHVKRKVCQTSGKVPVDQSGRQDFPSSFSDEKESDISPDGPLASSSAGPSRRRTVNRDQPIIHPPPKRPKTSGRKLTDDVDRYRPLLTTSSSTSIARPAQLPPSTLHPPPLLTSEVIGQEQRRFSPSQPSQPPPSGQAGPPYWNTYSNPPNPHSEYAPPQPQTAHMMQVVPPHHAHPFTSPPDQFQSYSAPNTATASNTEHQSGFMTGAQLETIASQQWGFNQITPAPWDPLPSNEYGAVYHDPPFSIDMTDWANAVVLETTDVPRVQESAERGTTAASDTSAVNPVTVDLLNTEFPELEMHYDLFNDALQSYWTNVAPSFPFVHRGLFKPAETPTQLLVMMAITGAAHFPQPRPDYAKTVQQVRGALVQQCGLEMPITTLQAFCLCHVYDTWYGTSESLFISQCTWPIMVAHSRKKGIGVQDASKRSPVSDLDGIEEEAENAWTAWAQDEERRRAAFCVLMVDTQISGFWNQHPSRQMSIFAHHIGLPCPKSEWEALSAAEWIRTRVALRAAKKARASLGNQYDGPSGQGASNLKPIPDVSPRKKKSTYLPSLHPDFQVSYVSEGYSRSLLSAMAAETTLSFAIDLDHTLGVQMILIGLCAAAWDFRTRGGMGFKLKNSSQSWRVLVLHGEY